MKENTEKKPAKTVERSGGGLCGVVPPSILEGGSLEIAYNKSLNELTFANGSRITGFSAEKPDRLRGPQFHGAWCDELAAWKNAREVWDMLAMTLRLGDDPRTFITTTSRPVPLVRDLVARQGRDTVVVNGSTFENEGNLAPTYLEQLKAQYDGTRLGRQELYAEVLTDTPGALWTRAMLESAQLSGPMPELVRVVVAVDPAISNSERSDETGIVVAGVAGSGVDARYFILGDYSLRGSPSEWADAVSSAFAAHKADRVVAEKNQGGDLVRANLEQVNPNLPIDLVHASRGKVVRAEPVAALYEQGRVSHVGSFSTLEDQMADFTATMNRSQQSPDRVDALVWGVTALIDVEPVRDFNLSSYGAYKSGGEGWTL